MGYDQKVQKAKNVFIAMKNGLIELKDENSLRALDSCRQFCNYFYA